MSALPYRPTGDQPRGRGLADMLIEHDEIVAWAETRNATPIVIAQSRHPHEFARLSLRFPDEEPGALYEPVEWHRWFALFEDRGLSFVCRDREPDGSLSREFRLARRSRIPRQVARAAL